MTGINTYQCVGLISGSSLDGVDLARLNFTIDPSKINPIVHWDLIKGETIPYPDELYKRLKTLPGDSAIALVDTDDQLGGFFSSCLLGFIGEADEIDFISTHGHTVFHNPGTSSTQIGNAAIIAAKTGTLTIGHLRNMDTAYGGHGAPLAPIADLYLFPEYDVCINLGGIANISVKGENGIVGYDVCGANQFLNIYANQLGKSYDDEGRSARTGTVDRHLLDLLNAIPYCHIPGPKSLDNEEVRSYYLPILGDSSRTPQDILCTIVEHIAIQLGRCIPVSTNEVMVAGGGALNTFLVERIAAVTGNDCQVIVPKSEIINFKEAALVALCGVLRLHDLPNSLKSITGASKNTINGVIFHP